MNINVHVKNAPRLCFLVLSFPSIQYCINVWNVEPLSMSARIYRVPPCLLPSLLFVWSSSAAATESEYNEWPSIILCWCSRFGFGGGCTERSIDERCYWRKQRLPITVAEEERERVQDNFHFELCRVLRVLEEETGSCPRLRNLNFQNYSFKQQISLSSSWLMTGDYPLVPFYHVYTLQADNFMKSAWKWIWLKCSSAPDCDGR
jgi:hypothetical protein